MSDDAADLDIADQLHRDLCVARLRDGDNAAVVIDRQKTGCFSSVPKTALNRLFVQPR
jgi:hypothetical protein